MGLSMLRCEVCEVEDGEELLGQPDAEVMKRACGEVLCRGCYGEHLVHDPSVGVYGCAICQSEIDRWWD